MYVFCIYSVNWQFDDHDIPYDVLWLDIEHTNGKRYLTWDTTKFPNPKGMQDNLAKTGRKVRRSKGRGSRGGVKEPSGE